MGSDGCAYRRALRGSGLAIHHTDQCADFLAQFEVGGFEFCRLGACAIQHILTSAYHRRQTRQGLLRVGNSQRLGVQGVGEDKKT